MISFFSFVLTAIWVFQFVFFYKKSEYYGFFREPAAQLVVFFMLVFPIFGALILGASLGLDFPTTILVGIIFLVGLTAIVSLLIPYIVSDYTPVSRISGFSTKFGTLIDIVGLIASILGILSFILQYL